MPILLIRSLVQERVFVVIPAYREGPVLRETVESLLPLQYEVVVVDDGSDDACIAHLQGLPVHYLRHPLNLGQGAALQTGTVYSLEAGADYIVHFDADGQHPVDQIPRLLEPIRSGTADVVLGSRFLKRSDLELVPVKKRIALRIGILVSGLLTGVWLTDTHNGFRALSAEAARKIDLRENRFAHATEFLDHLRLQHLRYQEIPSTIRYTEYSLRKGQPISNGLDIILDLLLRKVMK
jgi:glycosyltransferase involved in cell wall biosynthesis